MLADVDRDAAPDLVKLLNRCVQVLCCCCPASLTHGIAESRCHGNMTGNILIRLIRGRYKLRAKVDVADVSSANSVWVHIGSQKDEHGAAIPVCEREPEPHIPVAILMSRCICPA